MIQDSLNDTGHSSYLEAGMPLLQAVRRLVIYHFMFLGRTSLEFHPGIMPAAQDPLI